MRSLADGPQQSPSCLFAAEDKAIELGSRRTTIIFHFRHAVRAKASNSLLSKSPRF